jgi:glycosyl transferase family 2
MHAAALILFALGAFFWLVVGIRSALGTWRLPWLRNFAPAADADCPLVSIVFAARDEQEKLPQALESLLAIDYPNLEIVAVNDRSSDRTAELLKAAAGRSARLKVVHIAELPPGWLGKPHALHQGFQVSKGQLLLFTDADVKFRADVVRRAMTLMKSRKLDYLTLMCEVEMHGFWEHAALTFFGLGFHLATNPGGVSNPRSRSYMGIGAFQMIKRSAYVASGSHEKLALEVVDDMKLGKLVRLAGFPSAVGIAQEFVSVRWHAGIRNIVRGVTKNFFAVTGFSVAKVALHLCGLLCMNILPFVALPFLHGWTLALATFSVLFAVTLHAGAAWVMRASPLYALTEPLGASIFAYMLLRSTVVTLRQGGVVWRGTFYRLDELRRGLV